MSINLENRRKRAVEKEKRMRKHKAIEKKTVDNIASKKSS
jgi:hypothetical protein